MLPRRLGAYSPGWLDQLSAGGELVWIGAAPRGRTGPGRPLLPRGRAARRPATVEPEAERPEGDLHDAIRARLAAGPSFWLDLLRGRGSTRGDPQALWDLVRPGEVTNDAFAPLRAPRLTAVSGSARGPRASPSRKRPAPCDVGRWSLTAGLFPAPPGARGCGRRRS